MAMEYVIQILQREKKSIERHIRNTNLMQTDMKEAVQELTKITAIKKAIKIIKLKNRKR